MIVAFWSPYAGKGYTTSNMIAIAGMMALDYKIQGLIMRMNFSDDFLESCFSASYSRTSRSTEAAGIAALERSIYSGMHKNTKIIEDSSAILLDKRLDLLYGAPKKGSEDMFLKGVPILLGMAKDRYQVTFVDAGHGKDDAMCNAVLGRADLVVVNVNQSTYGLSRAKEVEKWPMEIDPKKVMYCVGCYERTAVLSAEKIRSILKASKRDFGVVPRSVRFLDHQNKGSALDYLSNARDIRPRMFDFNEDADFVGSVRKLARQIMERVSIVAAQEGGF